MDDKKGFGYDFLINVATVGKTQAKAGLDELISYAQNKKKHLVDTFNDDVGRSKYAAERLGKWASTSWKKTGEISDEKKEFRGDPFRKAVKAGLSPSDITSRMGNLMGLNPEEMSKRKQKEVAKEIKGLRDLRKELVGYYDASERGHKKWFLATHNITKAFRSTGEAAREAYGRMGGGSISLAPMALAVGGILLAFKAISMVVNVIVDSIKKAVTATIDLYRESFKLGKEMEDMSFKLRPFFGSREGALQGIDFAMKQKGWGWKDTLEGMQQISETGVEVIKNWDKFKDMAASGGASMAEFGSDLASTMNGNLRGLQRYGIVYLQAFEKIKDYPMKMRGAVMGFLNSIQSRYKGMAKEWEGSWSGMMNTLSNKWAMFKKDIIGSPTDPNSLYGWVKKTFADLLKWIDANGDKISNIAKGIGRLFRTVAQFVESCFSSVFTNFDKLTNAGIAEWFMRQEVKLGHFLNTIRLWIVENFGNGQMWDKIKLGINKVTTAAISLANAIERIATYAKGAERIVELLIQFATMNSGKSSMEIKDPYSKKSLEEIKQKGNPLYMQTVGKAITGNAERDKIKLEKGSEVKAPDTEKILKDINKGIADYYKLTILDMIFTKVKDENLRKVLYSKVQLGQTYDVYRTVHNMNK